MSTRQPISSVTLSASTPSVSFTNIPQTYTDLYLVVSGNSAGGYINTRIRFNSNVESSYSFTRLGVTFPGNTPTLSAGSEQSATSIRGAQMDNADNQFFTVNIMSYTNTNINKTVLVKTYNSDGGGYGDSPTVVTGLWRNTSAISSIIITTDGTSFASNTTFNLYGIDSSLSAQAKATGGTTIIRDNSYWYHVFTKSGTFAPTESITADVLVVAGGGGGASGGGGAGGLLTFTSQSLTAQNYTCTVGAGGAGGTGANNGTVGVDSQFGSLTLVKGGGYGGDLSQVGGNGGSGGGGGAAAVGTFAGGTATSGQGNNGGSQAGQNGTPYYSGGGGGAGAVGGNATASSSGAGGVGSSSYSSWGSATSTGQNVGGTYYYAGGGGGAPYLSGTTGAGGSGGGAAGGDGATNNGTANTGGGGGGRTNRAGGGAGGSGIVIIRYAV